MQQSADTKKTHSKKEDLYFTEDHEWIDFQGSVAYIGVSGSKLTGIRKIDKIILPEIGAFFNANEVIGSLSNGEYKIDVHMPVSGRVLSCNEELVT
jgi:glycine cleavage system H protein